MFWGKIIFIPIAKIIGHFKVVSSFVLKAITFGYLGFMGI